MVDQAGSVVLYLCCAAQLSISLYTLLHFSPGPKEANKSVHCEPRVEHSCVAERNIPHTDLINVNHLNHSGNNSTISFIIPIHAVSLTTLNTRLCTAD